MPDNLRERISTAARRSYSGAGYRQLAPTYDPVSGEGARLRGGRCNAPESYPVLYLCTTPACAAAEFMRYASQQPIGPTGFLPRHLYRYDVDLSAVLDLTDDETLNHLDVDPARIVGDDRTLPQQIGAIAHELDYEAVLARSATGIDTVLAVLLDNVRADRVEYQLEQVWASLDDLPAF